MPLLKRGRIWHAWYYDPAGEKIRFSCRTHDRKVAAEVLRKREREAHDPSAVLEEAPPRDRGPTLSLALEHAVAAPRRTPRTDATIDYYVSKGGQLLRLLPEYLEDITYAVVEDYILTRRKEGVMNSTIGKELATLRVVLKHARKRGEFARGVDEVLPDFSAASEPRHTFLEREQAARLLRELPPERADVVAFILATGARWAELLRAQKEDLLPGGLVRIRGTKTKKSWRTVPVAHPDWLRGVPPFEPWTNVRRDLHQACKRALVPAVSPNDLRRSCATWLRLDGVPPNLIAPILGHTTTMMVEGVYAKLAAEQLAATVAAARRTGS